MKASDAYYYQARRTLSKLATRLHPRWFYIYNSLQWMGESGIHNGARIVHGGEAKPSQAKSLVKDWDEVVSGGMDMAWRQYS
ncbi:hypothetical protein Pmani_010559 [Petrolisthes manimaculis]|uniref:Uncharacterized protein n=1 Tax=Petrolisthes manimaculis TaxID=1843537 RepID=A0AAE1Q1H3_9EUCA|nr:hypothetical protein Pmani_010559 [Petrolisthes manimaculis]